MKWFVSFDTAHEWFKTNSKYQEPEFYSGLFDETENGPFEVPLGSIKIYDLKNDYLMLQSCVFYRR